METLREILKRHSQQYPYMEIEDAVKLVYQHTFGWDQPLGAIDNERDRLCKEYDKAKEDKEDYLADDIGGGYVRVYLNGLPNGNLNMDKLCDIFMESCQEEKPNVGAFEENLEELIALTREDAFTFEYRELQRFLWDYEEKGYPPLEHSQRYLSTYEPYYRVVKLEILNREKTSFSKVFFRLYDRKLTSGEITFHSLGIPKPLFVVICNNSSYQPTDELLEKLKVTMKLTPEEAKELYEAGGKEYA